MQSKTVYLWSTVAICFNSMFKLVLIVLLAEESVQCKYDDE